MPPQKMNASTDKVSILSLNILAMPAFKSDKEQRDSVNSRMDSIVQTIKDSNADVVMLQEVHSGSSLEKKLIQRLGDDYCKVYHDVGQKVFYLGSGLMVMTKFKNVDFEFHAFEESRELPTRKGFGVLSIKNDEGEVVMRIADTHLQSGGPNQWETREHQVQQIKDYADEHSDAPFLFGGDLNIDRNSAEYHDEHPIKQFSDGFSSDEARARPTMRDFEVDEVADQTQAVDNIVGTHLGPWTMGEPEQLSSFESPSDPSDHSAMKVTLTRELGPEIIQLAKPSRQELPKPAKVSKRLKVGKILVRAGAFLSAGGILATGIGLAGGAAAGGVGAAVGWIPGAGIAAVGLAMMGAGTVLGLTGKNAEGNHPGFMGFFAEVLGRGSRPAQQRPAYLDELKDALTEVEVIQ